jgi:UDP-N-acetylmuramate dehydrogenase
LKWYNHKGAYFSELHANFLMNDWSANYKDLLELIKMAQDKVKKDFNIELINEVKIIVN